MAMREQTIRAVAARHGLGEAGVTALWDAVRRGGGRMAQFAHPELGGMGQWSGGGMIQIGDMFNDRLRASVAAACADLAEALRVEPQPAGKAPPRAGATAEGQDSPWWPADLGSPSASGAQNNLRYAYFAARRRLAIARGGRVTLYDTGRHQIFGVSQRQSRDQHLAFTADDGTVDLDSLPIVSA